MSEITEGIYLPPSPYPGINPFTYAYRNVLFAREEEARALLQLVVVYRGVLLYSESGVGKSSLVNAGLIPKIMAQGYQPERLRVQPKKGEEIVVDRLTVEASEEAEYLPSLFAANQQEQDPALSEHVALSVEQFMITLRREADPTRFLLIFDQFEEWTTLFEEGHTEYSADELRQMQQAILDVLVALLNDRQLPVKLLIVLREDYLAQLTPLFERCPTLVDQYIRLTPLDGEQVLRAIRGPFDEFPGHYRPEISADLAQTIREQFEERSQGADIRLTEVQIVCRSLFESAEQGSDPDQKFAEHKNVQGMLEEYLKSALASLPIDQQEPAVELLTRMVTSAGTRKRISQDDLLAQVTREGFSQGIVIATLDSLEQRAKLVRREPLRDVYYYEIASEFLVSWIQKQSDIRRLQRAEEKAARAGRMEEQERKIYDALESMKALERVNSSLREANLRMRILLGLLAIVCLAAAAAAVFAFVQKGEANVARDAAATSQVQAVTAAAQAAANEASALAAATAAAESLQVAQDSLATQEAGLIGQLRPTATATPTPGPTDTPVSGTPTPTQAGAPSASPTRTPQPTADTLATATAEALVSQLASVRATQTAVAQCPFAPEGEFSQIWKADQVQSRLGCPTQSSPVQGRFAQQPFENGYMYWSESPYLFIVIIGNDIGTWYLFRPDPPWPYNPGTSCAAEPPFGLDQPISGFGRLWCENPEIREKIGFATELEREVEGNSLQEFERGFILRDSSGRIYLLFGDSGEYIRDMVFVPGGLFLVGSPPGQGQADERPESSVELSGFWLDRFEATNVEYRECVAAGVCIEPHREDGTLQVHSATHERYYTDPRYDHFPVIFVSWSDARAYCRWSGKRLPTEAEWEWAAKGPTATLYSWGDQAPNATLVNYNGNVGDTRRVGMYPPGGLGLYDMAGNVWEWTSSLYMPYPYLPGDGRESPTALGKRVLRGGSWRDGPDDLRSANRDAGTEPDFPLDNVGFRCARSGE